MDQVMSDLNILIYEYFFGGSLTNLLIQITEKHLVEESESRESR